MKFKDAPEKTLFTWWDRAHLYRLCVTLQHKAGHAEEWEISFMDKEHMQNEKASQTGGNDQLKSQVDIILNLWDKKIDELKTLRDMLKMMVETGLSVGLSDNKIMSTSQVKQLGALTE